MLDGRRDDVIAGLCQTWLCQTEDGEVVSFSAAAGKYDFRSAATQKIRNRFARALHGGPRFLPMMMDGRRVPEMLTEVGTHGVENLGENGGAGVIVEIDPTHEYIFYACLAVRGTSARDGSVREFNHPRTRRHTKKTLYRIQPLCVTSCP